MFLPVVWTPVACWARSQRGRAVGHYRILKGARPIDDEARVVFCS